MWTRGPKNLYLFLYRWIAKSPHPDGGQGLSLFWMYAREDGSRTGSLSLEDFAEDRVAQRLLDVRPILAPYL